MKRYGLAMLVAAAFVAVVPATGVMAADAREKTSGFVLSSPEMVPGSTMAAEQVFNGFGCTGQNISPALSWTGAPADTRSFAVTAYDPDAPTGSGWWHWVVFNLPADSSGLGKGSGDPAAAAMPAGAVQSRTDFGVSGYGGPCPPQGDTPHHYQFTVYALKVDSLPLDANTPAAMVGYYLHQTMLDKAELEVRYGR
jgi:Raf kinase inhibitor-like YbhB/YbcL family protein